MEIACGQRDLKPVVVGCHAVRQPQDRIYVWESVDVLFGVDHGGAEGSRLSVACVACSRRVVTNLSKRHSSSRHCIPNLARERLVVFMTAEELDAVIANV